MSGEGRNYFSSYRTQVRSHVNASPTLHYAMPRQCGSREKIELASCTSSSLESGKR